MTKRKTSLGTLISSIVSLFLCLVVLTGTTYAWFTDSVQSGVNKLVAGNLDIDLYHNATGEVSLDGNSKVTAATELFRVDKWEPGVIAYENFTIKNTGSLALRYEFSLNQLIADGDDYTYNTVTWGANDTQYKLSDVLKIAVIASDEVYDGDTSATTTYSALLNTAIDGDDERQDFIESLTWMTWSEALESSKLLLSSTKTTTEIVDEQEVPTKTVNPLLSGQAKSFTVLLYWEPTDNDNYYNIQKSAYNSETNPTGWTLDRPSKENKDELFVTVGITLFATQTSYESDSFGNDYDKDA